MSARIGKSVGIRSFETTETPRCGECLPAPRQAKELLCVEVTMRSEGLQHKKGKIAPTGNDRAEEDGVRDDRPLSIFLSQRSPGRRWPKFTRELAARMNSSYWSDPAKRKCDAISEFYAEFDKENERGSRPGQDPLIRPSRETFRPWIKAGENYRSSRSKFGEASARRRYGGHDYDMSA